MPVAVIAHIRARPRIIGAVGLHAVRHRIVAGRRYRDRAIVLILVVVIAGRVIAGSVAADQRATDQGTGNRAGDEAAAAATIGITATAAATKARCRRAATAVAK